MSPLNKDSSSPPPFFLSFVHLFFFSSPYLLVLAKISSKMLAELGGVSIFALFLTLPESKLVKAQAGSVLPNCSP